MKCALTGCRICQCLCDNIASVQCVIHLCSQGAPEVWSGRGDNVMTKSTECTIMRAIRSSRGSEAVPAGATQARPAVILRPVQLCGRLSGGCKNTGSFDC